MSAPPFQSMVTRRRAMRNAARVAFAVMATTILGSGRAKQVVAAQCCNFPGERDCGCACNGASCSSCSGAIFCSPWLHYWPATGGCWTSGYEECPNVTCCDCWCTDYIGPEWTCGCDNQ